MANARSRPARPIARIAATVKIAIVNEVIDVAHKGAGENIPAQANAAIVTARNNLESEKCMAAFFVCPFPRAASDQFSRSPIYLETFERLKPSKVSQQLQNQSERSYCCPRISRDIF